MSQQADISRFIEQWLVDDEPDALPDRVLHTVADQLARHRQLSAPVGLLAIWRYAAIAAAVAVVAAASVLAYGALAPRPPGPRPSTPVATSSETASPSTPLVSPLPSASAVPRGTGGYDERISGRVQASGNGSSVTIDLRGWHWPPSPSSFALMRAVREIDGQSLGLWSLVAPRTPLPRRDVALTAVLRPGHTSPRATVTISFVDTPPEGLVALAERVVTETFDGDGRVTEVTSLTAGRTAVVRATTTDAIDMIDVAIYMIDLGETTAKVTFGAYRTDFPVLEPRFRRIVDSIRRAG